MATGRDRQEYPELPTNLIEKSAAELEQMTELNEILVRACHADPKQRYATAAELHADLALLQSGRSVSRMRTTEKRLRLVARAGAAVTAAALVAGVAFVYQQILTRSARRLALENRELAEEKSALADEKTALASELARIGEENRSRIVRLAIADGTRLLDEGDPAGALLWSTFSPDDRWLAIATRDQPVRVLDLKEGRLAAVLEGYWRLTPTTCGTLSIRNHSKRWVDCRAWKVMPKSLG